MKRTIYCGALRESDIGKRETLCGWVLNKRDMGGVIFLDVRDREGVAQAVFEPRNLSPEEFRAAEGIRLQSVVSVTGQVRLRDAETVNEKLSTGTVEVRAEQFTVLSLADPLPYSIDDGTAVREDLRLTYRYLDLRRPEMYRNLRYRRDVERAAEEYLDAHGFLNVETPMLCKSTPEGARDYLVPSRVHPGSFYALPQSPQIYKQLLMVGGIDRYYQIARCFRDEDLRADRQPEFTQVDMELSFVEQEDVLVLLEDLFRHIFRTVAGVELPPFPRKTWAECMDIYGTDKPDLRFDLPIVDLTDLASTCSFSVFRGVTDKGGVVRAIRVPGKADFTRTEIEELTAAAQSLGARGMAWIAVRPDGELYSVLTKYFTKEEMDALLARVGARPGDFVLFSADRLSTVRRVLGGLRLLLGDKLGLRDPKAYSFLIVTDFPQFEWSEEEGRFVATHHPFTMPYPEDLPYLKSDPARVRAQAYDVVLNGVEMSSGSVRIHDRGVQEQMFEALGFPEEQIEERFGFMVRAFRFGTPPHAGAAFGLDRLVMVMLGAESLRDVIAFPKLRDASCPMTSAPTPVDRAQLEVLGLDTAFEELEERKEEISRSRRNSRRTPRIDADAVARLSNLEFSEEEKRELSEDMASIVAFADRLTAADTEGVPPSFGTLPLENVFREDIPQILFTRDELLAAAPTKADGCITVPRVVEE